jgi:hypothetical protein
MLSVIILSVIILNVIMVNVAILSVIMFNVVAPSNAIILSKSNDCLEDLFISDIKPTSSTDADDDDADVLFLSILVIYGAQSYRTYALAS